MNSTEAYDYFTLFKSVMFTLLKSVTVTLNKNYHYTTCCLISANIASVITEKPKPRIWGKLT